MLVRSLIAVVLSIPATFAIVGVVLVLTPQTTSVILPVLLLVFPIWVILTVCSYLIAESRQVVIGLVVIAALGFGLIALLRLTGLTVV